MGTDLQLNLLPVVTNVYKCDNPHKHMFEIVAKDLQQIYGAESVARWGLYAFMHRKKELDATCEFLTTYLAHLDAATKTLLSARPEPILKNILTYLYDKKAYLKKSLPEVKKEIEMRANTLQDHIDKAPIRIAEIGARKINHKSSIYTHGYSSTVELLLRKAFVHDRSFTVHITETRPLAHGKVMAEELSKTNISVKYYLDVSMIEAIRKSDIILLGCIAANKKGFYHRAGSEMTAYLAHQFKKPIYICADTLKITEEVELQTLSPNLIWTPVKKATTFTQSFDCIPVKAIAGVICEEGILKPEEFLSIKNQFRVP